MADQFSSAPFIYPQGSFYQNLDDRIKSLETILGTGVGQLPDGIVSEFKLADSAVTARSIKNSTITGVKLATDSLAVATVASTAATTLTDADLIPASVASKSVKVTLANLVSNIFKSTRNIANAYFLSGSFYLLNTTAPTKRMQFDTAQITAGQTRNVVMADRNVSLDNVKRDVEVFRVSAVPAYSARQVFTHGRATPPTRVEFRLICTSVANATNSYGYAVGDVVYPATMDFDSNGAQWNVFTYCRLAAKTFEYQVYSGYLLLNLTANAWVGMTAAHAAAWDVEFTLVWD